MCGLVLRSRFQESSLVRTVLPPASVVFLSWKCTRLVLTHWFGVALAHITQVSLSYQWSTTNPWAMLLPVYRTWKWKGWRQAPITMCIPQLAPKVIPFPCSLYRCWWPSKGGRACVLKGFWGHHSTMPVLYPCPLLPLINVVTLCSPRSDSGHVDLETDIPCVNGTILVTQPLAILHSPPLWWLWVYCRGIVKIERGWILGMQWWWPEGFKRRHG